MDTYFKHSGIFNCVVKTNAFLYIWFTMAGWKVKSAQVNEDYDPNHVRTWTGWYNTDRPYSHGVGDDESVNSIRNRGYEICLGHSPVGAVCRDAVNEAITFNEDTRQLAYDHLYLPCNSLGVICRHEDQMNSNATCRDYEIRFECLVPRVTAAPENLGIIGVAAGLSVLVPILCVAIMHIVRLYRARNRLGEGPPVLNTEQSAQTESADLPPSYAALFGDGTLGTDRANSSRFAISIPDSGGEIQNSPSTQALQSIPENQMLTQVSEDSPSNTVQSSQVRRVSSWRRRFPNMHLSIFELFSSSGSSSSTEPSPTPSYMCTPPPLYKDAIIIVGSYSSNNGDTDETAEKTEDKN